MDFIKKYLSLVLPIALVLVAILFIALSFLINGSVKKSVQGSQGLANTIAKLSDTPSERQYQIEESYQNRHEQDAKRIDDLVKQTTLRELISYRIFPEPKETSPQIYQNFGEDCRSAVQELIAKINASDAPSKKEIDAARSVTGKRSRDDEKDDPLVDALCRKRAQEACVYANPESFSWYKLWEDYDYVGQEEAVQNCWYSQVAYWVYADVIDTIDELNADSEKVADSPVKRLVGVTFTTPANGEALSKGTKSSADTPAYVTEELPPILGSEAWTTRVGDKKIDVIHFSVSVILDANKVSGFMKELCSSKEHSFRGWSGREQRKNYKHNQITILSSDISPVIRDDKNNLYYRYGDGAIVQWTATCEYVFVRDAYDSIKPGFVKELLEQSTDY